MADDEFDLSADDSIAPKVVSSSKPPYWIIAVVIVCGLLYWQSHQPTPNPNPVPDDDIVIVDDNNKGTPKPPPVDVTGSTLIFVLEALQTSAEQEEVMLSVTTSSLRDRGVSGGFRRYDDDQEEVKSLIEYAVAKNTPPPFVALIKDKKPIKLASFPKLPSELQDFLR